MSDGFCFDLFEYRLSRENNSLDPPCLFPVIGINKRDSRWTSVIVGLPFVFFTSYILYERRKFFLFCFCFLSLFLDPLLYMSIH